MVFLTVNLCSEASQQKETILGLIGAQYPQNFQIRLPVTDQTSVIIGSQFFQNFISVQFFVQPFEGDSAIKDT